MSLIIKKQRDKRVIYAFTHKLADIPGGITVATKDFTQARLAEGTPVGKGDGGIFHIVKVATLTAAATASATDYQVAKGHNFRVGEFVMLKEGGKAYAITEIDATTSDAYDTIKVGTTLGVARAKGDGIYQAAKESAGTSSKFLYDPVALVGESYDVEKPNNLFVNAWTIGQIKEANIPGVGAEVKAKLSGISFI